MGLSRPLGSEKVNNGYLHNIQIRPNVFNANLLSPRAMTTWNAGLLWGLSAPSNFSSMPQGWLIAMELNIHSEYRHREQMQFRAGPEERSWLPRLLPLALEGFRESDAWHVASKVMPDCLVLAYWAEEAGMQRRWGRNDVGDGWTLVSISSVDQKAWILCMTQKTSD